MRSALRMLLLSLTVALLGAGAGGLRALHLVTEAGTHGEPALRNADPAGQVPGARCHRGHVDPLSGHAAPGTHACDSGRTDRHHDEGDCSTCELLLSLAGTTGDPVPVPSFHALVAVAEEASPAPAPSAVPLRALTARPPPSC